MSDPTPEMVEAARCKVAWLMWCLNEGYIEASDRAILSGNLFLEDPSKLHPDDAETRPGFLAMADQVLALAAALSVDTRTAELEAWHAECDAVGIPYDPVGLVRHHRASGQMAGALEAMTESARELAELRAQLAQIDSALTDEVINRDRAEKAADTLAYAIATEAEIGEHSSANDPWARAADFAADLRAEVEQLRAQLAARDYDVSSLKAALQTKSGVAEYRTRQAVDLQARLAAVMADLDYVEKTYNPRRPDELSDWGRGVAWMIDRIRNGYNAGLAAARSAGEPT